jgi:hypothetical protein
MILGLSTFGFVHTALCVLALACGLVVIAGLLAGRRLEGWTALYFASAVAGDATGFGFSRDFDFVHILGLIMALALLIAILARYVFRLAGLWRPAGAVATVMSVHVLVFFTIGEAFLRIPSLNALAPTLTETPFVVTQLAGILLFVALAVAAATAARRPG